MANKKAETIIIAGTATVVLFTGIIGACVGVDKAGSENALIDLNTSITQTLNDNGYSIANFNTTSYDWASNDDGCFFNFNGIATTLNNETIDFFSATYSVDPALYESTVKHFDNTIRDNMTSKSLLNYATDVVKNSELVSTNINQNVAISGIESSKLSQVDKGIVLKVSKPTVENNKASYVVCYTQPVKNTDGNLGLVTTYSKVSLDLTEEISKDLTAVYAADKEKAEVTVLDRLYTPVEMDQLKNYSEESLRQK